MGKQLWWLVNEYPLWKWHDWTFCIFYFIFEAKVLVSTQGILCKLTWNWCHQHKKVGMLKASCGKLCQKQPENTAMYGVMSTQKRWVSTQTIYSTRLTPTLLKMQTQNLRNLCGWDLKHCEQAGWGNKSFPDKDRPSAQNCCCWILRHETSPTLPVGQLCSIQTFSLKARKALQRHPWAKVHSALI